MKLIKEFPFATTFALAGFFVGVSVLFSLDFFVSYDTTLISSNPIDSLMNYIKDSLTQAGKAIMKGIFLGLILGLFFGIGGFLIDFLRKDAKNTVRYSKKSQETFYGRKFFW